MHERYVYKTSHKRWLALIGSVLLLVTLLVQAQTPLAHAAAATRSNHIIAHTGSFLTDCSPSSWYGNGPVFPYSATLTETPPANCSPNFAWYWTQGGSTPQSANAEWDGPIQSGTWGICVFIPNNHAGANAQYWIYDGSPQSGGRYVANTYINQESYNGCKTISGSNGLNFTHYPVVTMNNSGAKTLSGWQIAAYAVEFYFIG